ncbi:PREDICTED: uncharacterized protein LOC106916269 [Poecilia mexicana]|uniref:PDZ domain-containing protein n=1 Tax=Poecilia mexicana TaxID=48701 RepID=A0A3B3X424_9TELE|nr:PREDICTED: uncharacterized protein LOC106916269 [Poecilia mexicana]XP_014839924.1 PREDICTED: uncharacterized protein LOC106916269 [Poecilia mexicana]XP_014839925.1 PREDICTED: uncharacterized protein LOC106916269 [Poecilia mexicana]
MDLLPPSTSENNPQRTGTRFTVRSANSPSYSLSRRTGIRKRLTAENADDTNCSNTKEDLGFVYQKDINQNDTVERSPQENGTDAGGSLALHGLGRTEGRGGNLPNRSMSLDWRSKPRRTATAGEPGLLGKKEARGFEEGRTEIEKIPRGRVSSSSPSYFEDNRSVNHSDFADRVSKNSTLPVRFKTESGPGSRLDCPSGTQGGQSIKERIQKLFESAGDTTAGGTFPRRFSSCDDCIPVRKAAATMWAPKEANPPSSETSASFETVKLKGRSTDTRRQEELSSKYLGEDGYWRETIETGTKSLDRARSRNTFAGRIRSARTAIGMVQPQTYEESMLTQRKWYNQEDRRTDVTEISKAQKSNKEIDEGTKQQSKPWSGIGDDVFYAKPSEGTLPSPEWKKLPEIQSSSSASVRNKINQFEALTQRAANEVQIVRRTFSVQAQPCQPQNRIKKSGSAKYIGERSYRWETETDGSSEKRTMFASEKSLSLVDLGIKPGMSETDSGNSLDRRENDLSSLKKTLHIPLNEGAQKRSRFLFAKDSNLRDTVTLTHTSDMQPRPQWEISSPVSDDDKTPTNTPMNTSPFPSPFQEPEGFFPIADNMSLHVTGQEVKAKDTDSTLPPPVILSQTSESDVFITDNEKPRDNDSLDLPPDTSCQNNLSDVSCSNIKAELPKGRKQLLDLKAWIAGLDPEYKTWNEYMEGSEDDDESTQKDDDSNDSDSGDSSATITSNTSQTENRSFSLSLSNLCYFSGTDVESDNDNDDWQLPGRRSASLSSDVSAFSCVSLLPSDELDKLVEEVKNLGEETLQDYDDVQVVVLHKEVGVGLGFSLAGGVDQNKPVTVHKVFNSGVAAQEGSISEGDHVLSINGTAFSKSTHGEALRTLKKAKSREMAVVVVRKGDLSQTETQYETGQRVCIQLEKNSRGLGFSLKGGGDSYLGNRPLTVQKIFQRGPVDKVFPGDEILEIQGFSVVGRRRLEVWNFIKTLASGPVEVVLRRPLKVTQL